MTKRLIFLATFLHFILLPLSVHAQLSGANTKGDYGLLGRNRVYAFGPEVSFPLASKKKLYGFLDLRYLWETGARTTLEGNTFYGGL